MSATDTAASTSSKWKFGARAALVAALVPLEIVALDFVYDVNAVAGYAPTPAWLFANLIIKFLAYAALYAAAAFTLMLWPKRAAIAAAWREASAQRSWFTWVAINLAAFAALLAATVALRGGAPVIPWLAFLLWLSGVALTLAPLTLAAAPPAFWRTLAAENRTMLFAAGGAGLGISIASTLAQNSWDALAGATLRLSYWMLHLVEPSAIVDESTRRLGVPGFRVIVDQYCSGYEGIGLVLSAMGLFLWLFRAQLRFPRALILLPIGAALIWLLNGVRIALLVEMGAHWSQGAALRGFHSQAGWILFVGVTAGLMWWAQRARFFRADALAKAKKETDPAIRLAAALLLPFAALMAARVIAAAAGVDAHWVGPAAMVLPAAALWFYRDALRAQFGPIHWESIGVGVVVGALWIATEPAHSAATPFSAWFTTLPPQTSTAWLALRILGFALIVPFCEELAFRGYLHRALSARRFDEAQPAAFNRLAFIATSVVFGALHGRWLAGALAGAAYAAALYRSKSLTGPVTAHIASNSLIAAYAVIAGNWALL